jgi:hypothetical protein
MVYRTSPMQAAEHEAKSKEKLSKGKPRPVGMLGHGRGGSLIAFSAAHAAMGADSGRG